MNNILGGRRRIRTVKTFDQGNLLSDEEGFVVVAEPNDFSLDML